MVAHLRGQQAMTEHSEAKCIFYRDTDGDGDFNDKNTVLEKIVVFAGQADGTTTNLFGFDDSVYENKQAGTIEWIDLNNDGTRVVVGGNHI